MELVMVSACLTGVPCRFNGKAVSGSFTGVSFCPEVAGGLPTPRRPAEIVGGTGAQVLDGTAKVIDDAGSDCTQAFIDGAHAALRVAQARSIRRAVLMPRSPSCGSGTIYDGGFRGTLRDGDGVTAALLRRHGIEVTAAEVP